MSKEEGCQKSQKVGANANSIPTRKLKVKSTLREEAMEIKRGWALWLRKSSLAFELALSQALSQTLRSTLPQGCLGDPAAATFPNGWYFVWEGIAQPTIRLAWQRAAGFSLDVLEGTGSEAEDCHFSKIV